MDISVFSDPVKIGPGLWFKIHIDGIKSTTDLLKEAFIVNINALCDNFKCKKCQPHFRKFIDTHQFQKYWHIIDNKNRDIGFFQWTWELHNQVNRFLKKPEPSLEEAYEFFSNSEIGACFNCGPPNESKDDLTNLKSQPTILSENKFPAFTSVSQFVPEQRSRAIPQILTSYIEFGGIKPQPLKLIPR
jgi:hypothetical protein